MGELAAVSAKSQLSKNFPTAIENKYFFGTLQIVERDVTAALKLIGGTRKRGCPVEGVGDNVNIWVIRNHDKYKNYTAIELGKLYVGFYTEGKLKKEARK